MGWGVNTTLAGGHPGVSRGRGREISRGRGQGTWGGGNPGVLRGRGRGRGDSVAGPGVPCWADARLPRGKTCEGSEGPRGGGVEGRGLQAQEEKRGYSSVENRRTQHVLSVVQWDIFVWCTRTHACLPCKSIFEHTWLAWQEV